MKELSRLEPLNGLTERRLVLLVVGVLTLALAGCGFHPVGSHERLPDEMRVTYVQSGQPYGYLENLLRRAIVAHGYRVTERSKRATAVLHILGTTLKRRVLAVNSRGQPLQYALHYEVRFALSDATGHVILPPQNIDLRRNFAYKAGIALGASRRKRQLARDMQHEAVRLIMLQLEALPAAKHTRGLGRD